MSISLPLQQLSHAKDLPFPAYESQGAAGLDLRAAIPTDAPIILEPKAFCLVPTGVSIELPFGLEAQIRPRSGLAAKFGVSVLNAPGTIDSDYRGEIQVLLINHGAQAFKIERGLRIAQMVIAPIVNVTLRPVDHLGATQRGDSGFGSTGQ
jgi:dUTP pyrophosphatase